MVDLNTPQWWSRYLGAFGVKYDTFYELGKVSASQTWRRDTSDYMQMLLRHAEKNYSQNIVSYILGCGGATEWHDRSRGEESVYRLAAFRQWQKDHGKPQTDIPTRMARDAGSYDFDTTYIDHFSYYNGMDPTGCYEALFPYGVGLMRTPENDQAAMDYWRFCNEFNADTASFFLAGARQIIRPEAELGMFFGYGVGQWTLASSGHLAYERLLDSPDLDFITAPISYEGRGMGQGSTSMTVKESIHIKGKRMLQEMDQRTYTSNRKLADYFQLPDPLKTKAAEVIINDSTDSKELSKKFSMTTDGVWKNDEEIVAGMKRDTAFCLINQDSLWWFDMWGGFYQGDKVFASLKQLKQIWDEHSRFPGNNVSEILMVKDPDNMYLLNDMDARCGTFHSRALKALSMIGTAYTVCSFNDLEHLDLKPFKLVVFCHPFELTPRHQDVLNRLVLKDQRTVLWLYGPGIINNGKWDPDNVEAVCGTPFKAEGVNVREMKDWTSVYVHDPVTLTPEMMQSISANAGCHLYCSSLRPVCASERLLSVHTAIAETLEIKLRRKAGKITELFSGKVWEQTDQVNLTSMGPDSFLLLLED